MAKKRNKKHNPRRWAELATKGALRGLALVFVANGSNTNDVQLTDLAYYQSDLPIHLNHAHQEFLGDVGSKNTQINYAGWIARASGRELDQEEIFNIFEKLGAWA